MKAAIFTLDTESYKARKASAAGMVLKKLLEQSGFETAAVRSDPERPESGGIGIKKEWQRSRPQSWF